MRWPVLPGMGYDLFGTQTHPKKQPDAVPTLDTLEDVHTLRQRLQAGPQEVLLREW